MSKILVSGLINIETTLRVDGFPIHYSPVRYPFFGVNSTVSGVGYNVAKALTCLGDQVNFLSLVGGDHGGQLVLESLRQEGIPAAGVVIGLERTPQSVILYDGSGQRQINTDLKDIQDRNYPADGFAAALQGSELAVLCNINFSRPFLARANAAGVPVATDVHAIANLEDDYDRDFMSAAQILFMSDERLPCSPEEWARRLLNRYGLEIGVIGLGARGALLAVRQDRFIERLPAVYTRPVVSTIGAGDALFSAFIHFYQKTRDPYNALRKASVFASYKIGTAGAAEDFLDEGTLERWYGQVQNQTFSV